jgi:hypothetical protein
MKRGKIRSQPALFLVRAGVVTCSEKACLHDGGLTESTAVEFRKLLSGNE